MGAKCNEGIHCNAIPCSSIRFLMGRTHVSTPCRDIALDIFGRCARAGHTSPETAESFVVQALVEHSENRELYHDVTRGRI